MLSSPARWTESLVVSWINDTASARTAQFRCSVPTHTSVSGYRVSYVRVDNAGGPALPATLGLSSRTLSLGALHHSVRVIQTSPTTTVQEAHQDSIIGLCDSADPASYAPRDYVQLRQSVRVNDIDFALVDITTAAYQALAPNATVHVLVEFQVDDNYH